MKYKKKNCDSDILERQSKKIFLQLLKYSAFKCGGELYFTSFVEWKMMEQGYDKKANFKYKWGYVMNYSYPCSVSVHLHLLEKMRQYKKGKRVSSQQQETVRELHWVSNCQVS